MPQNWRIVANRRTDAARRAGPRGVRLLTAAQLTAPTDIPVDGPRLGYRH
ncbi:hypothetical protein [Micromonospora sediminicola]